MEIAKLRRWEVEKVRMDEGEKVNNARLGRI
jgi:hypothetical protein